MADNAEVKNGDLPRNSFPVEGMTNVGKISAVTMLTVITAHPRPLSGPARYRTWRGLIFINFVAQVTLASIQCLGLSKAAFPQVDTFCQAFA